MERLWEAWQNRGKVKKGGIIDSEDTKWGVNIVPGEYEGNVSPRTLERARQLQQDVQEATGEHLCLNVALSLLASSDFVRVGPIPGEEGE